MKSKIAQIAVPVRPFPELQCTMNTFSGSAISKIRQGQRLVLCSEEAQLTFEPGVALSCDLIEEGEGRPVVVRPVVIGDSASKVASGIVSGTLRCINDVVLVSMFVIQKV